MTLPSPGYRFLSRWAAPAVLLLLSALGAALPAAATTYYVDALSGKDTWAGTTGAPSGAPVNNGPWQTLARVAQAAFAPGDSVVLRCAQTWRETLALPATGAPTAPITLGHYSPATCDSNPVIDASQLVPDYAWRLQSGNVYQVKLPVDLHRNSGATAGFTSWSSAANHQLVADPACATSTSVCVSLTGGSTATIAISGTFAVEAGNRLNIEYRVRVPAGVTLSVIPRRGAVPFDAIGTTRTVVGNGGWQTLSYSSLFTTSTTLARIDFQLSPSAGKVDITDLRVSYPIASPTQVLSNSVPLPVAHHPNRGFLTALPSRIFASIAADADRTTFNNRTVSTYLSPGVDFQLPNGAVLTPGLGIVTRTNGWMMNEMKIASVQNGIITFDQPTTFPLDKNWGFYVTGARWMLDSPGEWHFDPNTSLLSVWMPDGQAPGSRVQLTTAEASLDLKGASYVTVAGIDVRGSSIGVRVRDGTNLVYSDSKIANNDQYAVDAVGCKFCEIRNNTISYSGRDAISATTMSGETTTDLRVMGNRITNSGTTGPTLSASDLPIRSFGAIRAGANAVVENNTVTNAGYIGILASRHSRIYGNRIENSCLLLDDCAGIYTMGADNSSVVDHNTVINVVGNLDGMPSYMSTLTSGIYLDDLTSYVQATNNTLVAADNGVHLHNASNNTVTGNILYGNRRYQIWAQEGSNRVRASGDVYGNAVAFNQFFPSVPLHPIQQETVFSSVNNFAVYSGNRYSTLLLKTIANEQWANGGAARDFPQWKTVRNQDLTGTEVSSIGYANFSVTGANILPNGNLSNGKTGWTFWNAIAPVGRTTLEACPQGSCIRYDAGSTVSLLSTPNFSTVKDRWYRVKFDARTSTDNQPFSVTVRRGGGGANAYEGLAAGSQSLVGQTVWQRYSFAFKAAKTVNAHDPITLDLGARMDFERIMPGTSITIGNIEALPLSPIETSLKTRILVNSTAQPLNIACPDQASDPALCTQFVKFSDSLPIAWPQLVPGYSSQVIFSRDSTLIDDDSDGVPNYQDQCPNTAAEAASNALGCSFAQSPTG